MSTHIALIGKSMEPVLKGFQMFGSVRKLFLLHSPNDEQFRFKDVAEQVRKRLRNVGFAGVELKEVNSFDMQSIIDSIIAIVDSNKPPFYINITGGTNLMAGAACSAAFFVGARAYYVLGRRGSDEARLLELPIPNIPYYRTLQKMQLAILRSISELGGSISNTAIREHLNLAPQKLSYHIRELESKALITARRGVSYTSPDRDAGNKIDRRRITISLTNAGKLVLSWTMPNLS